jgi:hypothetical protein
MNMIGKFATSLVAVAAFSAIIFASTSAGSMRSAQSDMVVATADASQSRVDSFSYAHEFTRLVEEPAPASASLISMRAEEPAPASGPLNAKETPQDQLNDLQYN